MYICHGVVPNFRLNIRALIVLILMSSSSLICVCTYKFQAMMNWYLSAMIITPGKYVVPRVVVIGIVYKFCYKNNAVAKYSTTITRTLTFSAFSTCRNRVVTASLAVGTQYLFSEIGSTGCEVKMWAILTANKYNKLLLLIRTRDWFAPGHDVVDDRQQGMQTLLTGRLKLTKTGMQIIVLRPR